MARHDRQKDDWYPTPFKATEKLLQVEDFDETVWEPAAGDGAISVVLEDSGYKTISSDLNDYGFCDAGVDFLMETERKADSLSHQPALQAGRRVCKARHTSGRTQTRMASASVVS